MGTGKKEAARRERQGKTGDGMANVRVKGENFYRDAKKMKTLNMFKDGKARRNAQGNITQAASYQGRDIPTARVEPNRKWFGNTRVISQDALTAFREAIEERQSDPYSVLVKSNKLPMSLIRDNQTKNGLKQHKAKMTVETAPFSETFGPKALRKRVKLSVDSLTDLAAETTKMHDKYLDHMEEVALLKGASAAIKSGDFGDDDEDGTLATARESIFSKGQSKRIYNELYKVIDSADVVIHVLDSRDPLGTRCRSVEKYIREEAPHKHLIFVLNKCDLVPTGVAATWVRLLSKEYPTLAFRSSINNSFGKGSLIQLLRQFSILHKDRRQISVGFIGYPNVGKSSIINTLRKKAVCKTAPIPGETKIWQYVTLMKRIYLIDCPGIVPPSSTDTEEDILLRGVVRVENVQNPSQYIEAVLSRVQPKHIERTYDIKGFGDSIEFLKTLARKGGRLLKGGEPDVDSVAKMVINDFLRGKIPWYSPPPKLEGQQESSALEGREGRLGEMIKKRKREDDDDDEEDANSDTNVGDEDESEFQAFDSDSEDAQTQVSENTTAVSQKKFDLSDADVNSRSETDEPDSEELPPS